MIIHKNQWRFIVVTWLNVLEDGLWFEHWPQPAACGRWDHSGYFRLVYKYVYIEIYIDACTSRPTRDSWQLPKASWTVLDIFFTGLSNQEISKGKRAGATSSKIWMWFQESSGCSLAFGVSTSQVASLVSTWILREHFRRKVGWDDDFY